MRQILAATLLTLIVLAAAACGGGDKEGGVAVINTLPPVSSTAPTIAAGLTTLADGLQIATIVPGTGESPRDGDLVTVNYSGWLKDGALFDSSLKEGGQPFQFVLGQGKVIAGWDEGIKLTKVGGLYRLVVPPDLGYGAQDKGSIPPNSTLVFDISVVSSEPFTVTPTPSPAPTVDSVPPPLDVQPTTLPDGIQFFTIEHGEGDPIGPNKHVFVNFQGWVLGGGQFIDTSAAGSQLFDFVTGQKQIIPGFDEGVQLMRAQGKYRLIIPPNLAFGSSGAGSIPPNSTVIFDVSVAVVQPLDTPSPTP